jgi:hypothetical protein
MNLKTDRSVRPNFKGQKGKSGRKKKAEEVRLYIEKIKEDITNEALLELSRKAVYEVLKSYPSLFTAKDFALPIALKGMSEKLDLTTKGEKKNGINYIIPNGNKHNSDPETA